MDDPFLAADADSSEGSLPAETFKPRNFWNSPWLHFILAFLLVSLAELFSTFVLHSLPDLPLIFKTFIRTLTLLVLISPVLYGFIFRVFQAEVKEKEDNENLLLNITKELEQKVAERTRALETSQAQLRTALENAQDAVISADGSGKIIYWNKMAENFFGFSAQEAMGELLTIIMPERFREAHSLGMKRYMTTQQPKVIGQTVELWGLKKDGTEFPLELSLSAWKASGKDFFTAIIRDITARKRAEGEAQKAYEALKAMQRDLIQSEKMAAVGQLASGIAHEVKNPLSVIIQGIGYLKDRLKSEKINDAEETLQMMRDAVIRADTLVHGLLDFSRPIELRLESLTIEPIVKKALTLLRTQTPLDKIKIISEISDDLPPAMLDKEQLVQVFINLFQNAVHAMPNGGELSIRCYTKVFDKKGNGVGSRATDMFRLGEAALMCEVRDSGMGIPSDKIQKVFEPFFTTKPRGEGTGLGLAVAKSIVDVHRGLINVTSEPGRGTTFTLSFHLAS